MCALQTPLFWRFTANHAKLVCLIAEICPVVEQHRVRDWDSSVPRA